MSTTVTIDPNATVRMELEVLDGRYRLEGLVATGGVATVVRATDLLLDRPVAVKLLREATDCAEDRARFLLETRTLARLSHPGLVTMLDAGTSEGRPYLVMELVDGPSMSSSLKAPLDLVRTAEIGAQVAQALSYAHGQGVVHRDVKPGNVLLRSDGRAKLADFGIARVVGERSEYTQTGIVVGSVHYLAPEQVAFEEITPAVDVYALGMLLLRAITGRHAFDGPTIETALARLSAAPAIPDDLPPGWQDLLGAMTARQPASRPTAAEVAEQLTMLSTLPTTTAVLPAAPLDEAPTARTVLHRRISPVALVAAALAIALYVAAAVAGGSGDPVAGDAAAATESDPPAAQRVHAAGSEIVPVADVQTPTPSTTRQTAPARPQAKRHQHEKKHQKPKHHGKPGKPGKGKH